MTSSSNSSVSLRFAAFAGLALVTVLLPTAAAWAQAQAVRSNVVSFGTTAVVEVTQDQLTVTLTATREGSEAAAVQSALKQVLEAAIAEARKAQAQSAQPGAFEARTGNFSLYPRHGRDGRIAGWQGVAELVLSGTDTGTVGQVAGKLNGMNVTQVGYSMSRALRERHHSQLTREAVGRFKARAAELAEAFGFGGYELGEVAVQTDEPGSVLPMPVMRMAKAEMDMAGAPLPVEPGKGSISVTVSGSVILKR